MSAGRGVPDVRQVLAPLRGRQGVASRGADPGDSRSHVQSAGGAATLSAVQGKATQSSVPAVGGESKRGQADIPGLVIPAVSRGTAVGQARIPGVVIPGSSIGAPVQSSARAQQPKPARGVARARAVTAAARIPGILPVTGTVPSYLSAGLSPRYSRSQVAPNIVATPGTAVQQAFIDRVAPGALAAQRQYGIPAAVTIAQAIDESRWGQSELAMQDNNLFGIKGTGPAGSVVRATQEYENGQPVAVTVWFRVYQNVTESIIDHCTLLATGYYQKAIADRNSPDAFANDLTGVYATDPDYGTNLISLMRLYNLYRYDIFTPHAVPQPATQAGAKPARNPAPQAQPSPHHATRGPRHTPDNEKPRPQPARPAGEDWEQFVLTMLGIPIIVNLFSSAVYESLENLPGKKSSTSSNSAS